MYGGHAFGPAILPRGFEAGTNGQVSWLEAEKLTLPGVYMPVGTALSQPDLLSPNARMKTEPLTVAGPRRIYTGFLLRDPFVLISYASTLAAHATSAQVRTLSHMMSQMMPREMLSTFPYIA